MSEQQRDESGEFSEKVTDQDVLKAFDAADAPFMTAGGLAAALPISRSGANHGSGECARPASSIVKRPAHGPSHGGRKSPRLCLRSSVLP